MNNGLVLLACGALFVPIVTSEVSAATYSYPYNWYTGTNAGKAAGTCIYQIPDIRPFQVARTLVVDNSIATGTVLFSWDYSNFLPNIGVKCTGSGIANSTGDMVYNGKVVNINAALLEMAMSGSSHTDGIFPTNISGLGIKLYVKAHSAVLTSYNGNRYQWIYLYNTESGTLYANKDVEYLYLRTPRLSNNVQIKGTAINSYSLGGEALLSIRGELVKTGNISGYGALSLASSTMSWTTMAIHSPALPTNLFAGSAITVAAPSCILDQTDYTIPMGRWVGDTYKYTGAIARGNDVPIKLSLKCSGRLSNVYFKFSDAGSSPNSGTERNISLYDSNGGKIDNLGIELRYNGNRVNIDGTTTINTGSHGTAKTDASSTPVYDSSSSVNFTANYLQTGNIVRNGNPYTGPVSGKLNMMVTYN